MGILLVAVSASQPTREGLGEHDMSSKRITIALLCLGGMLAGCNTPGKPGAFVQIGSTKAGLFGMPAEYRALHPRLESALNAQVQFNAQPNGKALGQQLDLGNIQYAMLTCKEYADLDDTSHIKVLAAAVNPLGKTSRKAFIVAKKSDARIQGIPDVKAKRFAFGTFGDVLTDKAAKRALEKGGCPPKDILFDLFPPPFGILGRLYMGNDAHKTVSFDATVNVGVVDEVVYAKLPASGGNFIVGPSQDLLAKIGETEEIPEWCFVAGPKADPAITAKLVDFLTTKAKDDKMVCEQLDVKGFAPADAAPYETVRNWLKAMPEEVPAEPNDKQSSASAAATVQ